MDALRSDEPLSEVNDLDYIPLLVLKEDLGRWPLEDSTAKLGKTTTPPPSQAKIREVARTLYRERASNPPNKPFAEQLIRAKLPGADRDLIRAILEDPEFKRRKPGRPPKSLPKS
jgi:hypothetical protein